MIDPLSNDKNVVGALLFLAAGTNALDVYSALNSSPWTAENFGADPEKAASCREYIFHSILVTSFFGITSGVIAQSWWPIIGTILANAYMWWLYNRALSRGAVAGTGGWAK